MKGLNLTGKRVILYDDLGKESVMIRIPKFRLSDVIDGAPKVLHPAFLIGGKERECIYISQYQNVVREQRAYSLPGEDPAVLCSIEEVDQYCRNKGPGWHLMTSAEWAAVALWSQKNETLPRGNNDSGSDWSRPHEHGTIASFHEIVPEGEEGPPMRIATGSGPASWSHDGTDEGIFDLNGNVWEMTSGLRLCDGVLEVIPDNDAAKCPLTSGSWQIIDGNHLRLGGDRKNALVMTRVLDEDEEGIRLTTADRRCEEDKETLFAPFSKVVAETESFSMGNLLQQLCLKPTKETCYYTDASWAEPKGVRYPIRGGYWVNREMAGIFAYGFYMRPEDRYFDVGFRCCFAEYEENENETDD